jgi:hypothetical protein
MTQTQYKARFEIRQPNVIEPSVAAVRDVMAGGAVDQQAARMWFFVIW